MDSTVIAAFIGLGGVGLAAALSGTGHFLKIRDERLKNRRSVLFYLLEIRYTLQADFFDSEEIAAQYIKHCQGHLAKKGVPEDESCPIELNDLIVSYFENLLNAIKTKFDHEFIVPFEASLLELSKEDPVLAYRIKGEESFAKIVQAQNEYVEKLKELPMISQDEIMMKVMPGQIRELKADVLRDIMLDLDKSIRTVSLSCGFITYVKCLNILNKAVESNIDFSEINELLDSFLEAVMDAANKAVQPQPVSGEA